MMITGVAVVKNLSELRVVAKVAMWFLPAIIASVLRHRNLGYIWLIDLLVGWIAIGWVSVLAWLLLPEKEKARRVSFSTQPQSNGLNIPQIMNKSKKLVRYFAVYGELSTPWMMTVKEAEKQFKLDVDFVNRMIEISETPADKAWWETKFPRIEYVE